MTSNRLVPASLNTTDMPETGTAKRKAPSQDVGDDVDELEKSTETTATPQDRMDQFKALRMRAKDSKKENRQALYAEHSRLKADPKAAKTLDHKKSVAAEKLAKLDAQEAGEDYERKRAWDYTVAESEAWDARVAKKKENAEAAGYADYASEAAAQYIRNTKDLKPDLSAYAKQQEALHKALGPAQQQASTTVSVAADGTVVHKTDRARQELNHVEFVHQKASKEGVDRLLASLSRVDAAKLKAQVKRGRMQGDEGDYINDQNKIFNAKVARHYSQYTKEMKDSFERGTAQ